MDAVARKALARNPEDRFQTAHRFLEALNTAIKARPDDDPLPLDLTRISRSGSGLTMADQLSADTTDALSRTLARWLGPIARLIVKQSLQETSDAHALVASLSRQIKSDAETALFRQAAEKLLAENLGLSSARARETISDAEIKAATDALISVIGPVAGRLVNREARTAVGRDDFYRRLAERIPDERAKARFFALRERPAGGKSH
jgi:serine/threonine-protein kinase